MDNGIVLLIVLGAFYVLVVPALAIVALVRASGIKRELEELRQAHRQLLQRLPVASPVTLSEAKGLAAAEMPPAVTQDASLRSVRQDEISPPPIVLPPPAKRITFEQLLGGRLFAWVGAAAVTLAGIFLVKYSIDQGWLGPTARVLLAALLGAIFVAAGELLRPRDARIAQAVTAAGVAVLYAALFAAASLYQLVPPGIGIVLAALLTALTVLLSLRQGPFVALLGLLGGAISPAIISQHANDVATLFAYLLALIAGVMIVVRQRAWWWLGWCALAVAVTWSGLWLAVGREADGFYWAGAFLVAIAALFVWSARPSAANAAPQSHPPGVLATLLWAALGLMLALAAILVAKTNFHIFPWAVFLAIGAMSFTVARQVDAWRFLAVLPPLLSLLVFCHWGQRILLTYDIGVEATRLALHALIVGGLISLGAYALLWKAPRPWLWAAIAGASAWLHFAVVCFFLFHSDLGLGWSYIALLLALPLALGALVVARRRHAPGMDDALGALAIGAIVFISSAVPLELRREWVTMSYALELPVVALLAWRARLPMLRWLVWLLAATVTIRLVFNPYVLDYDVSANPFLNWVLYGYGVAIVSYWITTLLIQRMPMDRLTEPLLLALQASMLAFGFLLLTLEVRSIFHPEGLGAPNFAVMERGWMSLSWAIMALILIAMAWRRPHPVLRWGARIVGAISLIAIAIGNLFWLDALFADGGVGAAGLFNGLIVLFGLPALLAVAASVMLRRSGEQEAATIAGIFALVLGFAFFSYQIRHWFNFAGHHRVAGSMQDAELYAYSIVWLLFGAALLLVGIVQRSTMLRYASLIVLVAVVGKVFLVDMSGLTGLLRVASFLGLGIGLLALGFIYRRYVFADDRPVATPG
ncbi:MAG: DUF2339 domain-containing protein [Rhodospirillales bacterium]